jgi:hypothetical protein
VVCLVIPVHEMHCWVVAQKPYNGDFAYANSLYILAKNLDMAVRTSTTNVSVSCLRGGSFIDG